MKDVLDADQAAMIGELAMMLHLVLSGGDDPACGDWVPWPRLRSSASCSPTVLGVDHRAGKQSGVCLQALGPAEVLVQFLAEEVDDR